MRWAIVDLTELHFSATEFSVNQENGIGVCRGDSGGPAYLKTTERFYLAGITSRGEKDCSHSLFTNGKTIKAFIDDHRRAQSSKIEDIDESDDVEIIDVIEAG
jgi:secreted trypsin-like serine protease